MMRLYSLLEYNINSRYIKVAKIDIKRFDAGLSDLMKLELQRLILKESARL